MRFDQPVIVDAMRPSGFVGVLRRARHSIRTAWQSGGSRSERARLAATLGRIALLTARRSATPPKPVEVLGLTIHVGNYDHFLHAFEDIFMNGLYDIALPTADPTIIDCGAHIGLSVMYFKSRFPEAAIIAFEPEEANYGLLQQNVAANGLTSVTCHRVALGADEGTTVFHAQEGNPGSLLGAVGAPSGRRYLTATQTVTVRRLSTYLHTQTDLLKLDVEGSEGMVLADLLGSGKIALVDRMIVEYHHHLGTPQLSLARALALLENAGFDFRIATPGYANAVKGSDFEDVLIYAYRPT